MKYEIIFCGEIWGHVSRTSMEMSHEAEALPQLHNLHLEIHIPVLLVLLGGRCCVLFMEDLMWLCRRVRHNGILLIKAAQHEHVVLGHDPVPAQPICISRRCPEGCIAECFHLLAQERPDQGNQFGFVTAIYALS